LSDRKVNVACIQETQWKGSGCKFYGAKGKRCKLFWMGGEDRSDGVGIFVTYTNPNPEPNLTTNPNYSTIYKLLVGLC